MNEYDKVCQCCGMEQSNRRTDKIVFRVEMFEDLKERKSERLVKILRGIRSWALEEGLSSRKIMDLRSSVLSETKYVCPYCNQEFSGDNR